MRVRIIVVRLVIKSRDAFFHLLFTKMVYDMIIEVMCFENFSM